jgi:hypothetical protein
LKRVVAAAAILAAAWALGAGGVRAEEAGALTGDWSGASICPPNRDGCHDEKALYHLKGPTDRDIVTIVGAKIVDGREIVMGPPTDFRFDPRKKTLVAETPFGIFRFTVSGTTIEGTMTSATGELYRKISLKKVVKES